jgi:arylsulfatase A-like enzyme
MIESMDESVGRVRPKLEEFKLADNTVVIFASDNGGRVPTTSNHPLRVGKGSCYEGGTRVPLIVYWPGVTKPASLCETPVISMDLFSTVLEIVGAAPETIRRGVDGVSLVPLLRQTGELKRDALFWHYPHYQHYQLGGTTPYGAIRAGDFKLIEFFDDMRVELYNLRDDIGEQHDLATRMPDKVEELRARLHAWRKEVGAQMPSRNPNYDPSKPEHDPTAKKKKEKEYVLRFSKYAPTPACNRLLNSFNGD